MMAESIRQCISCRTRKSKKDLLRIVRSPSGHVELDRQQNKMGRGLYLCFQASCIEKAKLYNLIQQKLNRKVQESIYLEIAEHVKKC
ncbi:YlxR family protein [bacterium]|nr:YlxR family protein [bacterium]